MALVVFAFVTALFVVGVWLTEPTPKDDDSRPPSWHRRNHE